jgi:hypothetical protein
MNRRDFLKLTAWFSVAPAAALGLQRDAILDSTAARNSMLDAIISQAVYFAICDAGSDEIIGITKIKAPPAAQGKVVFGGFTIEVTKSCSLGKAKFLDADECEILSFWPNYTHREATIGGNVTLTNFSLQTG